MIIIYVIFLFLCIYSAILHFSIVQIHIVLDNERNIF